MPNTSIPNEITNTQICLLRAVHALHPPRTRHEFNEVAFDELIDFTRFQRLHSLQDLSKLHQLELGVQEWQLPTETLVLIDEPFMAPLTMQMLAAREATRRTTPDLDPRPLSAKIAPESRGRMDLPLTPAAYLLLAALARETRPVTLHVLTGRFAYPPGGADMRNALAELQQKGWGVIVDGDEVARVKIPHAPSVNPQRRRFAIWAALGFPVAAALAALFAG